MTLRAPRLPVLRSSVRVRLTLWNTLTLAFVLVALGVAVRFVAKNYLLNALDRDIKMQAQRFQEKHQVKMVFVANSSSGKSAPDPIKLLQSSGFDPSRYLSALNMPPATAMKNAQVSFRIATDKHALSGFVPSSPPARAEKQQAETRYNIVQNISAAADITSQEADVSGQYLYRTFDLQGKPLSPLALKLPFDFLPLPVSALEETKQSLEDYRLWDKASFQAALNGQERLSTVLWKDAALRVLSQPLYKEEDNNAGNAAPRQIIGVVQIAAPLGQVQRDIAGLTRTLLLILPIALLAAAGTGVFLTHRALLPVKSLAHAATRLRPEQLSQRLPIRGADEFDELAGAFNRALDRVEQTFLQREQAMEQLRRFTADASHELRTPLTTIKANTGIALKETEPSEEHLHALRQIDRATDRMTALVRDLLLLARSDAGQILPDARAVSLYDILQEVAVDVANAPASGPRTPITLQASEPNLTVCGNADHLHRLFLNLLENALRYTPSEGQITVITERDGQCGVVCVRDTGCGIGAEHLSHLGERFYRADAGRNRKHGGAGLGIAICRAIVAQHGGTLSIQSELGKGTTVTVRLPLFSA